MTDLLKLRTAAALIGVAPGVLRRWLKRGVGPRHFRTVGGHFRFREPDILRWIEGRSVELREEPQ